MNESLDTNSKVVQEGVETPNRFRIVSRAMQETGLASDPRGLKNHNDIQITLLNVVCGYDKINRSQLREKVLEIIKKRELENLIIIPESNFREQIYSTAEEWLDDLLSELVENGFLEDE